jgi:hypothetical protein
VGKKPIDVAKYKYVGIFNRFEFTAAVFAQLRANGRFDADAVDPMLTLLGMIEADTRMVDIRWAAYMLATVFWETTSPKTELVQAKNKKGLPLKDKKGNPIMLKKTRWLMTMSPVDEVGHGKGRRYHEPAKVSRQPDGSAIVVEQDGDKFSVSAAGSIKPLTKKAKMGTTDGGAAVKAYEDDAGAENAYFGRGYVQLTWWSNYAKAGVSIGKGLDLLIDPEAVKDPEVAYALMADGLINGSGFANGRKFSQYLNGAKTDYANARRMVNGTDHAEDIAKIARKFEEILITSKLQPETAGPTPP